MSCIPSLFEIGLELSEMSKMRKVNKTTDGLRPWAFSSGELTKRPKGLTILHLVDPCHNFWGIPYTRIPMVFQKSNLRILHNLFPVPYYFFQDQFRYVFYEKTSWASTTTKVIFIIFLQEPKQVFCFFTCYTSVCLFFWAISRLAKFNGGVILTPINP